MKNIVIIGGGISGYLILMNLLRTPGAQRLNVVLLEKERLDRLGVPYETTEEAHLLNVPVSNMSAFSDDKNHFADWLLKNAIDFTPLSFMPRKIYRQYILDIFNHLMKYKSELINVSMLQAEAVDVDMEGKNVLLNGAGQLSFDQLIMATGTFPPGHLALKNNDYTHSANYFPSAWQPGLMDSLKGLEEIFIIGTGLTMTDTIISLHKRGHKGKVTAISRHGLMPAVHKKCIPYPCFGEDMRKQVTILGMFGILKKHLKQAAIIGSDWRAVTDALRPHIPQLWNQLAEVERKAFIEHLRHRWEVCRHRMPEECALIVHSWLATGKITMYAGRIRQISESAEAGFCITYIQEKTQLIKQLKADVIINCMGPLTDYNLIVHDLIRNLMQKGVICADPLGLGLQCSAEGALIQQDGRVSDCFYTIGAPAKGTLWETTAVPEIRVQAKQLADRVTGMHKPLLQYSNS
ncbi:putative NAD(P)/FAD-binding protein YdhS [Pedobacter psychrotolerans]|uniref:Putative NAD(P)/FAD-binding protein YdhS n=1 Tax=Pedobacter psychrotolerans TaxID=1843235 RepID=A0A4R2HC93_9SPHI|nr:FAD/NAD(P)-binding protein [Pedobacter psychrotolerans]TCO25217.1 putative NAD(P)/FAD-binding protein YdhS [Pedobacter psychrotolerans]GGE47169.1 hypothetical protein GCM10011413_11620 [Pedobacter psychrotolerans]